MAADPKLLLTTQPEKPNHYTYLKEFRVEQCQSFLQHKCNQHRPFICFNWHFMNQRRRRPVRKRDGTFNYSADNYCGKYDETTGICADGDECPFLHRTAGDTERRYHLRYYKTCMCVHDTDTRGYCVKNGHHCAFAHGLHDQRPPVFDIKEIEASQSTDGCGNGGNGAAGNGHGNIIGGGSGNGGNNGGSCGGEMINNAPNALDKERNLMNEDPKWQDTNYVLANYKTEPCKRPPRLCRQGYACPQYHNSKDKRRSPRKFKYRSTPCPNVKHGEEWGEPANCEAGDNCQYCHTRTEQQFHPEIYKSTKCNDVQQAGYCPRSVFCAFAHVEPYILTEDMQSGLDNGGPTGNLALGDLLGNVLNLDGGNGSGVGNNNAAMKKDRFGIDGLLLQNGGSGESCESASTSSVGSNQSHSKAPGAQLHQNKHNQHMQQQHQQQQQQQQMHHLHQQQQHQHQQQQQQHQQQHHLFQNSLNNNLNNPHLGNINNNNNNNHNNGGIGNGLLNAVVGSGTGLGGLSPFQDFTPDLTKQLMAIENDTLMSALEKEQRKRMCVTFGLQGIGGGVGGGANGSTVGLVGSLDKFGNNGLDDLVVGGGRRDFGHMENSISAGLASSGLLQSGHATQPVNIPGNAQLSDSLSGFLQGNSAPVNIPDNFSPNLFSNHFGHISGSAPKMHNNFGGGSGLGNANASAGSVGGLHNDTNSSSSLFFQPQLSDALDISPDLGFNSHTLNGLSDMHRLRDELTNHSAMKNLEDRILQASKACEAWRSEADESNRKAHIAEQQRDNALSHVQLVTEKLDQVGGGGGVALPRDLRCLSIQNLKGLQAKLRSDLEEVEKVLYMETATKCMKCEENNRSVTLVPCNHYVLCEQCAKTVRDCPYCQTPVTSI